MLDDTTVAFLGTGCGLIVATVSPDGAPRASRGWGIAVVSAEEGRLRVVCDADDAPTLANLAEGAAVAVTAASVRTLHSIQMKGRSAGLDEATDGDVAVSARYCEQFIVDVHETDGVPEERIRRLIPTRLAAWHFEVRELFDQTPGPGAGGAVGAAP